MIFLFSKEDLVVFSSGEGQISNMKMMSAIFAELMDLSTAITRRGQRVDMGQDAEEPGWERCWEQELGRASREQPFREIRWAIFLNQEARMSRRIDVGSVRRARSHDQKYLAI